MNNPTIASKINPFLHQRKMKSNLDAINHLKKAFFVYFCLLIIEGALRKWVLPGLATPLLIVRDPVAIYILLYAMNKNVVRFNIKTNIVFIVTLISFALTMVFGHQNVVVALFGVRIFLFHFPLIFVFGSILDRGNVIYIGKVLLMISIPMTLLMAAQFFSPQSSFVNKGIGGDSEGGGFSGALGFFRPPGTFSFISGLAAFYGLCAAYIFYFWISAKDEVNSWILRISSFCLLAAIPFSISRTLLFEVVLSAAAAGVIVVRNPKYIKQIIITVIVGIILIAILSNTEFFSTSTAAFTSRFDTANDSEGGIKGTLVDRFLGGLVSAIADADKYPFGGLGIGLGTNAGAKITTGKADFIFAEDEWARLIGEMGLLLGITIIIIRTSMVFSWFSRAYRLLSVGNILPWMLLSFGALSVLQGQWGQPTALGFAVISGGLILGAFNNSGVK